jgi:hypothetical protein
MAAGVALDEFCKCGNKGKDKYKEYLKNKT